MTAAIVTLLLSAAPGYAELSLSDCTIAHTLAKCGRLRVPEDRDNRSGRHLALNVIVLLHTGARQPQEPVFVLSGGPGQAATALAEDLADAFRPLRESRAIVLIDQRGTGGTNRLDCVTASRTFVVPADTERCLARLKQRATLGVYGTEHFVDDLEAARVALGYDRINLYGASYGTRAAYVYARRYPTRVGSLVLVAPAPISMPVLDSFDEDGARALSALLDDCMSDQACGRSFPTLREDVQKLRRLDDPYYAIGLQFLLYSSTTSRAIPYLIVEAVAGRTEPLDLAIDGFRAYLTQELSLGLHLTVMCSEDLPFGAASESPDRWSVTRREYSKACLGWPRVGHSSDLRQRVRLNLPALVIAGEWDPITGPRWAHEAAGQFAHSQVVIVPKRGHILSGSASCLAVTAREFLDRQRTDASCLARLERPPYTLRPQ